jgi:hypothetical protein
MGLSGGAGRLSRHVAGGDHRLRTMPAKIWKKPGMERGELIHRTETSFMLFRPAPR